MSRKLATENRGGDCRRQLVDNILSVVTVSRRPWLRPSVWLSGPLCEYRQSRTVSQRLSSFLTAYQHTPRSYRTLHLLHECCIKIRI